MRKYTPKEIESKWQKVWAESRIYEVTEDKTKKKIYATPMLPYPSGAGLHIGHVRNYSIADAIARFYRQRGYNVMSNIGWDAFGLPAENYAIKTGTPPAISTATNTANFKHQLQRLGMSYAWDREINTSDPSYYKWTQWVFKQLFEDGLAYQSENLQWWCTQCKTVLANEQVENGKCWRHSGEDDPLVEKRLTKQWFFRITNYADDLLDGLEDLDWPESIITQQRNWIGRSSGAEIEFATEDGQLIKVFTTRADTIYGATFMVLAPENQLLEKITTSKQRPAVLDYVQNSVKKTEIERMDEGKEKTGVFSGAYALNPATKKKIPIWISDFVLGGYGTGAIMAVPGHDQRDNDFATKFDLPIVEVVKVDSSHDVVTGVYSGEGELQNSGTYNEMKSELAREKIVVDLAKQKVATEKINYRIRDWLISRQRYWGAPIPIIHCPDCGPVSVPDSDLPVILPEVDDFRPTGKAVSVLASVEDWVNVECPKCHKPSKRETDTLDGYACSSWYMHRYTDADNQKMAWDPEKLNYWFPIDYYFGGDHAVSHLLYFRFWNRYFVDKGLVKKEAIEPVKKLVFNGYINADDGHKMSKSLGNVVDPLDIIDSGYGADALRLFELFVGPYDQDVQWNPNGVPGTYRFLQRVWGLVQEFVDTPDKKDSLDDKKATIINIAVHKTIFKVTKDLEREHFNTAIAACMELVNNLNKLKLEMPMKDAGAVWHQALTSLVMLLAPFAPHITEEMWSQLGMSGSVHISGWPEWNDELIKDDVVTIVVQINGKVRANLEVESGATQEKVYKLAMKHENVINFTRDYEITKQVFVKNRILNLVVKQ